jgi:adenylate kinase
MIVKGDHGRWIYGEHGACVRTDGHPERPFRLVLLGAPGVGKGTQAALIAEHYGACALSTGDVFRAAAHIRAEARTAALANALDCMQQGKLVPDEAVVDLVRERIPCIGCGYGFLLDGFPRTVDQAEALDDMLADQGVELDAVLNFTLDTEEIVCRLSGRRTCSECKATFHMIYRTPRVEGVCNHCGGELYQREDDHPESIKVRLQEYERNTAPLANFYAARGLLHNISAVGSPPEVFVRTQGTLQDVADMARL